MPGPVSDNDPQSAVVILAEARYALLPRELQQEMALCPITEACVRRYLWGDCSLELALTTAIVELGKANRKLVELAMNGPPAQMIVCSPFNGALDLAVPKVADPVADAADAAIIAAATSSPRARAADGS